jgi:hypothetical protein
MARSARSRPDFTDPAGFLGAARHLPDLTPEVAYLIKPDLFYGSWRKAEPGDLRNKVVKLYQPRPTRRNMVLGTAALGQEQELVRYYQSVMQAAAAHRKGLRELRHYFWLRPVLLSRGEAVLTFPWHDTYPQAAEVLQSLTSPEPEGLLYHDLDQGWQLAIYATADKLYFQQGDDDGRVADRYVTDRARLQTLAAAALARTRQQLETIVRGVGQDFWQFCPAAQW